MTKHPPLVTPCRAPLPPPRARQPPRFGGAGGSSTVEEEPIPPRHAGTRTGTPAVHRRRSAQAAPWHDRTPAPTTHAPSHRRPSSDHSPGTPTRAHASARWAAWQRFSLLSLGSPRADEHTVSQKTGVENQMGLLNRLQRIREGSPFALLSLGAARRTPTSARHPLRLRSLPKSGGAPKAPRGLPRLSASGRL